MNCGKLSEQSVAPVLRFFRPSSHALSVFQYRKAVTGEFAPVHKVLTKRSFPGDSAIPARRPNREFMTLAVWKLRRRPQNCNIRIGGAASVNLRCEIAMPRKSMLRASAFLHSQDPKWSYGFLARLTLLIHEKSPRKGIVTGPPDQS